MGHVSCRHGRGFYPDLANPSGKQGFHREREPVGKREEGRVQ